MWKPWILSLRKRKYLLQGLVCFVFRDASNNIFDDIIKISSPSLRWFNNNSLNKDNEIHLLKQKNPIASQGCLGLWWTAHSRPSIRSITYRIFLWNTTYPEAKDQRLVIREPLISLLSCRAPFHSEDSWTVKAMRSMGCLGSFFSVCGLASGGPLVWKQLICALLLLQPWRYSRDVWTMEFAWAMSFLQINVLLLPEGLRIAQLYRRKR